MKVLDGDCFCLSPKARESFEEPKGREGPERIRRGGLRVAHGEIREPAAGQQSASPQHSADEDKLSDLHADVEGKERQWQVVLRQADLRKRTGEAKAVQQPEAKRHYPRPARGETRLAAIPPRNFHGEQQNA